MSNKAENNNVCLDVILCLCLGTNGFTAAPPGVWLTAELYMQAKVQLVAAGCCWVMQ